MKFSQNSLKSIPNVEVWTSTKASRLIKQGHNRFERMHLRLFISIIGPKVVGIGYHSNSSSEGDDATSSGLSLAFLLLPPSPPSLLPHNDTQTTLTSHMFRKGCFCRWGDPDHRRLLRWEGPFTARLSLTHSLTHILTLSHSQFVPLVFSVPSHTLITILVRATYFGSVHDQWPLCHRRWRGDGREYWSAFKFDGSGGERERERYSGKISTDAIAGANPPNLLC